MSRIGGFLCVLLLLGSCRGRETTSPFAESRVPSNLGASYFAPEGWTWGYVQSGKWPAQRYGVASTSRVPAAQVIILPGYGESAEVWFETARDLVEAGDTVWILERAGQGGSGRFLGPHDLGFVPSFDPDFNTFKAFLDVVVRPTHEVPLILLAHADGAVVALHASQIGSVLDGIILSSPHLENAPKARIIGLDRLGFGGWKSWSRSSPNSLDSELTHDPIRGRINLAWQTANPDLRMGSPSRAWTAALGEASREVIEESSRVEADILMIHGGDAPRNTQDLCDRLKVCQLVTVVGARPALHLEGDQWRASWLTTVKRFITAKADTTRELHKQ
jgi:lysophospholipase